MDEDSYHSTEITNTQMVYSYPLSNGGFFWGGGGVITACCAKPRCANSLWAKQDYVNADAYAPPHRLKYIFGTLHFYTVLGQLVLPASAEVQWVTARVYPRVFKIFSFALGDRLL
jgi:hypothetical protein